MAEAPFCLLHVKEAWRRLIHILHPPQKQISPQNHFHFIVFSVSMIKNLLKPYFLPVAFPMRAECSSASLRTLSIIDSELIVAPLTASISVVGISFNAAPFQLFREPLPRNARQKPRSIFISADQNTDNLSVTDSNSHFDRPRISALSFLLRHRR